MRGVILAVVLLAGCVAEPELVSYRDQSVPIASQVDVTLAELEGRWLVREAIGAWGLPIIVTFDLEDMEMRELSDSYIDGELISSGFAAVTHSIRAFEQGRISAVATLSVSYSVEELTNEPTLEYWILWADADRRTVAIGTPDGTFGFIMDRERFGGEDRIAAARDIMARMGYRVEEMRR